MERLSPYCNKVICPEITTVVCLITQGGESALYLPCEHSSSGSLRLSPADSFHGAVRIPQ